MRIIQLSDIHLSSSNKEILTAHYMDSLINDLKEFHHEVPIDVILLTGDLVDKGGTSLGNDPYGIFRKLFIDPILNRIGLRSEQILFIPGNHDIQRNQIDEENEYFLISHLSKETVNNKIKEHRDKPNKVNKRIKKFKDFERKFHQNTIGYNFSYNESSIIIEQDSVKVGFALINDSWRCSSDLKKENHFIGTSQIFNAKNYFTTNKTSINIAVFHHPLELINSAEAEEFEGILQSLEFDIALFGHTHRHNYASVSASNGNIVIINGRSALNDPNETQSKFQSGYNILDLDLKTRNFTIHARKYIHNQYRFDNDVDTFVEGIKSGTLQKQTYFPLANLPKTQSNGLPLSYQADVNRIVKLLIGKSLYPNQYIFVRELIQNSVDACNRIQEKYTNLTPKIIININTTENSFEIIDDGDGMSKKVLSEHFSVIGKSISQEFNDSINSVNLISQFGIGFISTFIVAQKMYIRTKSEDDELINFEIEDVFKGFIYNPNPTLGPLKPGSTGTSVKVYLKSMYSAHEAFNQIRAFCRHVNNIDYYLDGSLSNYLDSWNLEGGLYNHVIKNSKYVCKLTIGSNYRTIIASNSGFLINTNPLQIIPARFPNIIGGEVNFEPRSIDFDLSRTNIMETQKSLDFKKDISISLRILFRNTLESKNQEILANILNYVMYYLAFYENNLALTNSNYSDFYTKKELIDICLNYINFSYNNTNKTLLEILMNLRDLGINTIYYINQNQYSDLGTIVYNYLIESGNFIIQQYQISVHFRETSQNFSSIDALMVLAREYGFTMVDINSVVDSQITKIKTSTPSIPERISSVIKLIETFSRRGISVGRLGSNYKLSLSFGNETILNYDHKSFQSLITSSEETHDIIIQFYLLGMLSNDITIQFKGSQKD